MASKIFYVIINAQKELKTHSRHVTLYKTEKNATAAAWRDGDTVVRLTWNQDEEPVFIRRKVL